MGKPVFDLGFLRQHLLSVSNFLFATAILVGTSELKAQPVGLECSSNFSISMAFPLIPSMSEHTFPAVVKKPSRHNIDLELARLVDLSNYEDINLLTPSDQATLIRELQYLATPEGRAQRIRDLASAHLNRPGINIEDNQFLKGLVMRSDSGSDRQHKATEERVVRIANSSPPGTSPMTIAELTTITFIRHAQKSDQSLTPQYTDMVNYDMRISARDVSEFIVATFPIFKGIILGIDRGSEFLNLQLGTSTRGRAADLQFSQGKPYQELIVIYYQLKELQSTFDRIKYVSNRVRGANQVESLRIDFLRAWASLEESLTAFSNHFGSEKLDELLKSQVGQLQWVTKPDGRVQIVFNRVI